MLPQKNRADRKEIEAIFKKGRILNSTNLAFRFILTDGKNTPKISIIAPKSIAKKAVERNNLRRLGYLALEKHIKDFPVGILGAFIYKRYQKDKLIILNEIEYILKNINEKTNK